MKKEELYRYIGIVVGTFITSLAFNFFLIPNKIAPGGISGIATVLYYLFRLPVGVTMLVMNIPLFIAGVKTLGGVFGLKSLIATILLSFFIDIIKVEPLTHDVMLASVYGGIAMGVGLGIVFKSGATTGGTDLAAKIVHKFFPFITIGWLLFVIDFCVVIMAAVVFGPEMALYALVSLFIASKLIDIIQEGLNRAKAFIIISDHNDAIGRAVMEKMGRGVTNLLGEGMFTGTKKRVLLCVVSRLEITRLKNIVYEIDPKAFVILTDVREVIGEGFTWK
ncbi:MAG TPA: YitT family protein [Clostridiales bacterium]|nr:YitT family protein [Clostridiales bacterium]